MSELLSNYGVPFHFEAEAKDSRDITQDKQLEINKGSPSFQIELI